MLKIEHLTKCYGDKKAVDDLSLHILPGEIYGFIGHNGAGKTTTLKASVGILAFDEGEITIDGVSVKDDPLGCKKKIAYIPDNPDLYDYMTGIRYLNFIADIFKISQADRTERIRRYAVEGVRPDGSTVPLCDGTSVGHKRIQMFKPVDVKALRLVIKESAAQPLVKAFTAWNVNGRIV